MDSRKTPADREHWSRVAREWIAWARTPNHDAFWAYRKSLAGFVGRGDGEALDVGCGEGRVSRELTSLGWRVTAVDPVTALLEAAAQASSAHAHAVADGAALPFGDGRFDLVMAYNLLMNVVEPGATLKELRRVMRADGVLVLSVVHPFLGLGRLEGTGPDARLVLEGGYFGRRRFEAVEEHDGLRMRFAGWSQPLEAYARDLEEAGLAITSLREPRPEGSTNDPRLAQWMRVPMFLWIAARPLAR